MSSRLRQRLNRKMGKPAFAATVQAVLANSAKIFDALPAGSVITFFADGRKPKITLKDNIKHSMEFLQAEVGGYLESVPGFAGLEFYCNEEGLLKGLSRNLHVSEFCQHEVVGNVVLRVQPRTREVGVRLLSIFNIYS